MTRARIVYSEDRKERFKFRADWRYLDHQTFERGRWKTVSTYRDVGELSVRRRLRKAALKEIAS